MPPLLFRILSLLRLPRRRVRANHAHNAALPPLPALIPYGQRDARLAAYRYGVTSFGHTGCGVLACRNVLALLGQAVPLAELVHRLETEGGQMLLGLFGTAPYALARLLGNYHLRLVPLQTGAEATAYLAKNDGAVLLLTFWNGRSPFAGMHTVAAAQTQGGLLVYNRYDGDTAPRFVRSLPELLAKGKYITGYAAEK